MKNNIILHLLASKAKVPIYRAQTPFTGRSTDNLLRSSQCPLSHKKHRPTSFVALNIPPFSRGVPDVIPTSKTL